METFGYGFCSCNKIPPFLDLIKSNPSAFQPCHGVFISFLEGRSFFPSIKFHLPLAPKKHIQIPDLFHIMGRRCFFINFTYQLASKKNMTPDPKTAFSKGKFHQHKNCLKKKVRNEKQRCSSTGVGFSPINLNLVVFSEPWWLIFLGRDSPIG